MAVLVYALLNQLITICHKFSLVGRTPPTTWLTNQSACSATQLSVFGPLIKDRKVMVRQYGSVSWWALGFIVMNQGIGPQQANTKPPCHKGNKHRTHPFGFPTGLGPDRLWEIHAVTL